ncbi:MAG: hypothetical protein K6G85_01375 [Eubacterium sp.]|nr:hypothetical protein [Eubacterium sp.]
MKKVGKSRRTVMGLMLVIVMCSLTACTTKQAKQSESSRYAMNEKAADETNKRTETKKENKTEEKNQEKDKAQKENAKEESTEKKKAKKHKVKEHKEYSGSGKQHKDSFNETIAQTETKSEKGCIGMDKAKSIALNASRINRKGVTFTSQYFSDGKYHLTFKNGGSIQYCYTVDGKTGTILDHYTYDGDCNYDGDDDDDDDDEWDCDEGDDCDDDWDDDEGWHRHKGRHHHGDWDDDDC